MPETLFKRRILPGLVFSIGVIFYAYEYLLRVFPSLMTQELMQRYAITGLQLGNLIALYYYSYTLMQLPVGLLLDRFGPRRVLPFAAASCVLGIYLFHSPSFFCAGLGRFCMGLGSAFAFVGSLDLARVWLPQRLFGFFTGITVTTGLLGAMYGDIWLAQLSQRYQWSTVLLGLGVAGFIIVLLMLVMLNDQHENRPVNNTGLRLSIKQLIAGLIQLMRDGRIWLNGLLGCLLYLPLSAFAELWATPYLQTVYHLPLVMAAKMAGQVFLGWAIGAPIVGWLSSIFDRWYRLIGIAAIITAGLFSGLLMGSMHSTTLLQILLFAIGFVSSCQVLILPIANRTSPSNLSVTALAFTNMMIMLGGVVTQPLIGFWLDHLRIRQGLSAYSASAYQQALMSLSAACLIAACMCFWLARMDKTKR